jgi:hypothetical protein
MPTMFICLFKDPHSCICINQEGYEREKEKEIFKLTMLHVQEL